MLNAKCVNLMIIMPSQVFIHKKSCFLRMFKEGSCTRIFIYLLLMHDERIFQEESSLKFDSLVSQLPLKMTVTLIQHIPSWSLPAFEYYNYHYAVCVCVFWDASLTC